jgi:hypothetical protein
MAPKRNHLSSRSSRKEETKHTRPETINGASSTDTNDTSLQHGSNIHISHNNTSLQHSSNIHGFHNDHLSTTSQASSQQHASSQHQREYQYIDRPWEQNTTNAGHTVPASHASPMERWYNANAHDQPWHGIEAIYVDPQNTQGGIDWSEYNGGETQRSEMDSMAGECSTEGRWIG